jgi:hypothetical protein
MKPIRFTRGSRRHRIGKASAYHVIAYSEATVETDPDTGDVVLTWLAADERGRQLEIIAVEKPDCFLVIHVMPIYPEEKP